MYATQPLDRHNPGNRAVTTTVHVVDPARPESDRVIATLPGGGWTIFWNKNGNWTKGNTPKSAFDKVQEIVKGGGTLRSGSRRGSIAMMPSRVNSDWMCSTEPSTGRPSG